MQLLAAGQSVEDISARVKLEEVGDGHYGPFHEKTGMQDFQAYDDTVGKIQDKFLKKRQKTVQAEYLRVIKAINIEENVLKRRCVNMDKST
eukprot:15329266-Ditylum_brightwellii.AAC.1